MNIKLEVYMYWPIGKCKETNKSHKSISQQQEYMYMTLNSSACQKIVCMQNKQDSSHYFCLGLVFELEIFMGSEKPPNDFRIHVITSWEAPPCLVPFESNNKYVQTAKTNYITNKV